jgi:protein-disulfide isomerase
MPPDTPFDQSIADEFCKRLSEGREMSDVCKDGYMPSSATVTQWCLLNPAFKNQFADAMEQMLDAQARKNDGWLSQAKIDLRRTGWRFFKNVQIGSDPNSIAKASVLAEQIGGAQYNPDRFSQGGVWASLLLVVAVIYLFALSAGFSHYLNFLPSDEWTKISAALSLVLALASAVIVTPVLSALNQSCISLQTGNNNKKFISRGGVAIGGFWGKTLSVLLSGVCFYNLLAFGVGPAATALSYTTIEKDIVGTKAYQSNRRSANDYYIKTTDLPVGDFAKFYITRNEYDTGPNDVRVHVTLRQSDFGMAIERYTISRAPPSQSGQGPGNIADISATPAFKKSADDIYNNPATPALGNPHGNVTIVEYFDYRCVYCKTTERNLVRLLQSDKNIKIVYKDFPKLGPLSTTLATATLASLRQGPDKYSKLREALLVGHTPVKSEEDLYHLAGSLGLDVEKLKQDMNDPAIASQIRDNIAVGKSIGVQMTPTFVINGYFSPGAADYGYLRQMVNYVRSSRTTALKSN